MEDFYRGKSIFITGATGFVGKVILEKILRSLDVDKIYILIRPKRGCSPADRLITDVIESKIWERLHAERPDAAALIQSKLVAVGGDMLGDNLGLSPEDLHIIRTQCQILIHCAATVSFEEPLDVAINMNTLGALRVMSVAHSMERLESYVHVSTCYVNCDKHVPLIEEKVYPMEFEPEELIREVAGMDKGQIETKLLDVIGEYPNTYTLTKAMAEVLLERRRGSLPLTIFRPSIVGSAWREPVPGWVDVISAAGAVFSAAGTGFLTMLPGSPRNIADIVPVDFVANSLLAATFVNAGQNRLLVTHSATSCSDTPLRWRVTIKTVAQYFQANPTTVRVRDPRFRFHESHQLFQVMWFLQYALPSSVYSTYANAFGSAADRKNAARLWNVVWKARTLVNAFKFFTTNEFRFDITHLTAVEAALSDRDRELFAFDASVIDWPLYIRHFCYGLSRWMFREDVIPVTDKSVENTNIKLTTERLLDWDPDHHRVSFPGVLSDVVWAYTSSRRPGYTQNGVLGRLMGLTGWREGQAHEAKHVARAPCPLTGDMVELVLSDPNVQRVIKGLVAANGGGDEAVDTQTATARRHLQQIMATLTPNAPRMLAWFLRKVLRQMYDGVVMDESGLERVRAAVQQGKYPVLMLPTHRSYMDFLVLSYFFFAYNLPLPFIAAGEDFLNLGFISDMLRQSGAFFMKRSFRNDPLYGAVLLGYLQQLMRHAQVVEFFLEGTRSRSGKMLPPKTGLMDAALEPMIDGAVEDVLLVPVSIDFERALEASLYSNEVLGQSKLKESLPNLLRARTVLKKKFGHISVQFGEILSAREQLTKAVVRLDNSGSIESLRRSSKESVADEPVSAVLPVSPLRQRAVRAVAYDVIGAMHATAVVMPTHLVATVLLHYRNGIRSDELVRRVDWLRQEVGKRGVGVECVEGEGRQQVVHRALSLLGDLVRQREGRDLWEPNVSGRAEYSRMVSLGYYRNKLIHVFCRDGMWAVGLYAQAKRSPAAVAESAAESGTATAATVAGTAAPMTAEADLADVTKSAQFLNDLLHREFVRNQPQGPDADMRAALHTALQHNVFVTRRSKHSTVRVLAVPPRSELQFSMLCTFVWPFVDSYWVAVLALAAMPRHPLTAGAHHADTSRGHAERGPAPVDGDASGMYVASKQLLHHMQWLAETMYYDKMIRFYESCSMETLNNALSRLVDMGVLERGVVQAPPPVGEMIRRNTKGVMVDCVRLSPAYRDTVVLSGLARSIDRFRKPAQVSLSHDPFESNTLTADVPMLARL